MDILSGRRRGLGASLARAGLAAAAVPYAAVMRARRWFYRRGLLPSRAADAPVICVGNLTTGGTGKTPMVAWVVARLHEAGGTPAILTRGYKGEGGTSDEAELLKALTGAPVVVDPDRAAGAAEAVRGGADVLVMDDGFQHRRLRRDLDLVLIDATNPFGYGWCLPRGLLREPRSALRDADAVVITRSSGVSDERLEALKTRLSRLAPGATVHAAVHVPTDVLDQHGISQPASALEGRRVFAFGGLGNPEAFFATVRRLGAEVVGRQALADHVDYDAEMLGRLVAQAENVGAELLVTTQKDGVKLTTMERPMAIWQLVVEMRLIEGARALAEAIARAAGAEPPMRWGV